MTQPSKGAAVFLTLFGLPFLGGGLAFIYAQLLSRGNFKTFDIFTGIMFGSVFVFIGGGLIYAAFGGYGLLKQQASRKESNPLSPWLWRLDWASSRAESQNKKSEIASWVFAILCNLVTLPFLFRMIPNFARKGDPRVFLLLGCNLFGVILIVKALRATIRHRRFGDAYFEFDALPFSPGERVVGRIHLKLDSRAEHGIDLRLSCVRKLVSGSGDDRSTNQIALLQAEQFDWCCGRRPIRKRVCAHRRDASRCRAPRVNRVSGESFHPHVRREKKAGHRTRSTRHRSADDELWRAMPLRSESRQTGCRRGAETRADRHCARNSESC